MRGMTEMGFELYLALKDLSLIITTFRYRRGEHFNLEEFYQRPSQLGFVIGTPCMIDSLEVRVLYPT